MQQVYKVLHFYKWEIYTRERVYYVIRSKNVLCAEAGSFSLIPFSFSLGLCISIPPSLFLFPLYLSRPSLFSVFSSLYISLCIIFSLLKGYFC
jgi:hypothetical protein